MFLQALDLHHLVLLHIGRYLREFAYVGLSQCYLCVVFIELGVEEFFHLDQLMQVGLAYSNALLDGFVCILVLEVLLVTL